MEPVEPKEQTSIHIENLTKSYGAETKSASESLAVETVSMTVRAGEMTFLLGPSGCGKTTLLRMVAGFIEPTRGEIVFVRDGVRTNMKAVPPQRRNAGMVFQSYALWPHMTVMENVSFGLEMRGFTWNTVRERATRALAAVRMEEFSSRKPAQLSGGQQQRVALARAIAIEPSVLLLDEPLSNLDARLRVELRTEIRRVCKAHGITAMYVTHDQQEALSMADRIAVMNKGKLLEIGTPEELYQRPQTEFVAEFLGETNFIAPSGIRKASDGVVYSIPGGELPSALPELKEPYCLSVRPECISFCGRGERGSLDAKVEGVSLLGGTTLVDVRTSGGLPLRIVRLSSESLPARGEEISIRCEARSVVPVTKTGR